MKRLLWIPLLFLCSTLWAAEPVQLARMGVGIVGGSGTSAAGVTYEFTENFEGSQQDSLTRVGYNNTGWIGYEPGTANQPRYTTAPAPLQGTYSFLAGDGNYANITHPFTTSAATVHAFLLLQTTALVADVQPLLWFRDVSDTTVLELRFTATTGTYALVSGTASATLTMAEDTTYCVWLDYTASTSGSIYVAAISGATCTKPSVTATTTGGSPATTNATKAIFFRGDSYTTGTVMDHIILDGTQAIGDNP